MSENYTQWSSMIYNLSPEEAAWAKEVDGFLKAVDLKTGYDSVNRSDVAVLAFDFPVVADLTETVSVLCEQEYLGDAQFDVTDNGLWFHADDDGDLGMTAAIVQDFIRRWRPDLIFHIEYANTCSKPRVGEFSGGVVVISYEGIDWMHTTTWAKRRINEIEWRRTHERA